MTEISFHFNVVEKISYACRVLRKAVNSGNTVVVAGEASTLADLDMALWTFSPLDFIPHCLHSTDPDEFQVGASPILLGDSNVLFGRQQVLLNLGSSVAEGFERFEKLIEVVTSDEDNRQAARMRWKHYASRGYDLIRHDLAARPQSNMP